MTPSPLPLSGRSLRHISLQKAVLWLAILGSIWITLAQAASGPAPVSQSRRVLSGIHTDAISVFVEGGSLVLGTKADVDEEHGVPLDPDLTIFNVEEATRMAIPDLPSFAFLGGAGSDVWLAPETNPEGAVLWPGFNTEDVEAGAVDGDQVTLRLEAVNGPGALHIFQSDVFGQPIRRFSSTGTDFREWVVPIGTHAHANWAFTAPGRYTLTFTTSGLIGGTPVSTTQNYTFVVGDVPNPTITLTGLASNQPSVVLGEEVTLRATVTPSGASGWVEFLDGSTILGHDLVTAGTAGLTTNLPLGARAITARFVPQWSNDFGGSTSSSVAVNVTETPGGPVFSVAGVANPYQPGDSLNLQVAGHTLQSGQQYRFHLRAGGSTSTGGINLQTSASDSYTTVLSASDDDYEFSVSVRQGSTVVAQSAWVTVSVTQDGDRPTLTRARAGEILYAGNALVELTAAGLNLASGETIEFVRRNASTRWAAFTNDANSTVTYPEPHRALVDRTTFSGTANFFYAARVVRNGVAVRQSEPVFVEMANWDLNTTGLLQLYREGATLNLATEVHPTPPGSGWEYRWRLGNGGPADPVIGTFTEAGSIHLSLAGLTKAAHDGKHVRLWMYKDGVQVGIGAALLLRVTDDLTSQFFTLTDLADHYHQGGNIGLQLVVDPALLPGDQIKWEWKWPGMDWVLFPGITGEQKTITAEQALDGVEVRATLDFAAEGKESMVASPITIHVDDHGAAARQKLSVTGGLNYVAGNAIQLGASISHATVLNAYQWQRQAAGEAEFVTVAGATSASFTLAASTADHGAQYRVATVKPDGSVAYGPSPAVTLSVTASDYVPFRNLASYGGVMGSSANMIAIGDVNGDGQPDMIAAGGTPGTLTLIKNGGGGQFLPGVLLNEGSAFYVFGVYPADVDGDGDLDFITGEADQATTTGSVSNGEIVCYLNDGTGNFTRQTQISGLDTLATYIQVADLNGDGRQDVFYRVSASTVVYRPALSAGGFGPEVTIINNLAPSEYPTAAFLAADKDGDGDRDLFLMDDGAGRLLVLENDGTGQFTPEGAGLPVDLYNSISDVADVTGDGRPDVLIQGFLGGVGYRGTVAIQQADGSFAAPVPLLPDSAMYASAVGDFNQDTIPDLVTGIYGTNGYVLRLHLGTGGGQFSLPQMLIPQLWYPNDIKIRDLDGNGSPDLAVAVSSAGNPVYVLLNSEGGNPRQLVPPAGRVYTQDDSLELSIYFGSPVTVTGVPRVALQVGGSTVYADYVSGSGTPSLLFRYSVGAADLDLDGVQLASGATIELNSGALTDFSGNAFTLEIPATTFEGVVVNGSSPLVQGIVRADSTPTNAPTVRFNVTFSAAVEGVEATDFELVQGGEEFEGAAIQSVTGTGTSYQVTVSTGTGSGVLGLHVKAGATITGSGGVPFSKPYEGGEVYTFRRGPAKTTEHLYTSEDGHADYRPILENGLFAWGFVGEHGHDEEEEEEEHGEYVHSDELTTFVGPTAKVARAASANYNFLGVAAGEFLHLITSGQTTGVPYLGWSGESVPAGVLASYLNADPRVNATNAYMKIQLAAVRSTTGGAFSVYSISSGNPRVWMATSDGISATDAFFLRPGSHAHYNVGFSKPGIYEVDVFVSGYRDTNGNGTLDAVKDPYFEGGLQTMIFRVDTEGGATPVTIAQTMDGFAPTAVGDEFAFQHGAAYTGNVLANDTDPQSQALSAVLKTPASQGTVELNANGNFTYTPANVNFIGRDSFVYWAHDGNGGWSEATASVRITPLPPQEPMRPGQNLNLAVGIPTGGKILVSGLPPGLKYDPKTKSIIGRTTTPGSYLISVVITDAQGNTTTTLLPLTVQALPEDIRGTFIGYVTEVSTGHLNPRSGGRIDLTVGATGLYTLKVVQGAVTTSLKGYLDLSAPTPKIIATLKSGFEFEIELASGEFTGSVTSGVNVAAVSGWRSAHDAKFNPAWAQHGYYTVGLTQASTAAGHPQGHGYLAVTVGLDGKTTVTGKAADGSTIASTGFLGANNKVLVAQSLYANKGIVGGVLELDLDADGSYLENELEGTLTWLKPATTTGRNALESGFALPLEAYGKYLAPNAKGTVLGLPSPGDDTTLEFISPAITGADPSVDGVTVSYPLVKAIVPTNPAKTSLTLTKTTGAIKGAFTLTDGSIKRTGVFQGMIVRGPNDEIHALGYALLPLLPGTGQSAASTQIVSGAVEWLPTP